MIEFKHILFEYQIDLDWYKNDRLNVLIEESFNN